MGLRLFLPESWTSDQTRLAKAGVPKDRRGYRTKPETALEKIDRLRGAGLRFACVLADAGYGVRSARAVPAGAERTGLIPAALGIDR